jgi:hypothetical protein
MLCCLLIALSGGPLLLWVKPAARAGDRQNCCTDSRRLLLALSVAAGLLIAACTTMLALEWLSPTRVPHICRVLVQTSLP